MTDTIAKIETELLADLNARGTTAALLPGSQLKAAENLASRGAGVIVRDGWLVWLRAA